jgi:hypothetical protein
MFAAAVHRLRGGNHRWWQGWALPRQPRLRHVNRANEYQSEHKEVRVLTQGTDSMRGPPDHSATVRAPVGKPVFGLRKVMLGRGQQMRSSTAA